MTSYVALLRGINVGGHAKVAMDDLRQLFTDLGHADVKTYIETPAGEPDELAIVGRDVYLHCPNGYGRTKLNNAYIEKRLVLAATTRGWKRVTKLHALAVG